jgi:hypothetical protein
MAISMPGNPTGIRTMTCTHSCMGILPVIPWVFTCRFYKSLTGWDNFTGNIYLQYLCTVKYRRFYYHSRDNKEKDPGVGACGGVIISPLIVMVVIITWWLS